MITLVTIIILPTLLFYVCFQFWDTTCPGEVTNVFSCWKNVLLFKIWLLLRYNHYFKTLCIQVSKNHSCSHGSVSLFSALHRWVNEGSERLNTLPEFFQLVLDGANIQNQVIKLWTRLMHLTTTSLLFIASTNISVLSLQ